MSETLLLSVTIYGIAIVISVLVALLIKAIVAALPLMQGRRQPVAAATPAAAPSAVPAEHIAAIAGALAAMAGARHIVHIEDRGRGAVWTAEGRMMHQTSHAVSRTPKR